MTTDDFRADEQPEAGAGNGTGLDGAISALEHAFTVGFRNSHSSVADRDHGAVAGAAQVDVDVGSLG